MHDIPLVAILQAIVPKRKKEKMTPQEIKDHLPDFIELIDPSHSSFMIAFFQWTGLVPWS